MIRPEPKQLFAVVGNPVRHTLSPAMMTAAFHAMEIPAVYTALYMDDPAEDLKTLYKAGFSGLSVTIPYKEMACRLASEVDKTAREIGAVNCLRRTGSGWEGRNTDWVGALEALSRAGELSNKKALIIGAGGAARAVAYGVQKAGAIITIANRCVERGRALAKHLGSGFIPLKTLEATSRDFDVVVQCTSVGLGGGPESPVSPAFFRPGMIVMDIVYRPRWTAFSSAARDAGCTVVSGLDMLLYQGVTQIEWWLGRHVPSYPAVSAMRAALEKAAYDEEPH